ncbi:MAG: TetR/AcrR family transcriptional regulator [Bacteroidales bacterium]
MSPRSKEQVEEIRESRRQQIMDAALHLFANEGYAHCTISNLAEHAGISKGLMYNYFSSKQELLESIIQQGLNELLNLFDPNRDGILTSGEFVEFIRKLFSIMRGNKEFWVLYVSILMQPGVKEHLNERSIPGYREFIRILMDYLTRKGFEDPELEALTLSAMIEGLGVLMVYAHPVMDIPDELLHKYENRIIDMYK